MKKNIQLFIILAFILIPVLSFAHQPRLTESRFTTITEPEISKAYYAELVGEPDIYVINASSSFNLYVNILVPDIIGQNKDVSIVILKKEGVDVPLAVLNGLNFEWKKFFEPFGYDTYWMGPEYKAPVEAGKYEIKVSSSNNDSKYSLAVGEAEAFDFKESVNALILIPQIKNDFFNESSISFIFSPFGWGLILIMYILAFIFGFIFRFVTKKIAKSSTGKVRKNIGKYDRFTRLIISIVLLLWAITTSWNFIILFLSGYVMFEAIFSWCVLYSLLGKNTCPICSE